MAQFCDNLIEAVYNDDMTVMSQETKAHFGMDEGARANVIGIFRCYQAAIKKYNYNAQDLYDMDNESKTNAVFVRLQNDSELNRTTRSLAREVLKQGGEYLLWTY